MPFLDYIPKNKAEWIFDEIHILQLATKVIYIGIEQLKVYIKLYIYIGTEVCI